LVGSNLVKNLSNSHFVSEIIGSNRKDTNLFSLDETLRTIKDVNPDLIVNAAAKVGGILANNTFRTEFILENLKININILEALINFPSTKLINLGSSCIYPLNAPIPTSEKSLMDGKLEPTNSPYSMAKIAAIEMGNALKSQYGHKIINLMPTNLYGPNDNFDLNSSHVIPGLIVKFHNAIKNGNENIEIWGTGKPKREFLYVDDLSSAVEFLLEKEWEDDLLNVGSGEEISIKELSYLLKEITMFDGDIIFDTTKPDGNPRKLLDSGKINSLGWKSSTSLSSGLQKTFEWYKNNY
jgi:GDP-L-fucose synthase